MSAEQATLSLAKMKLHYFLAAPWEVFQRLAVIGANEAEPRIEAHGAAVLVKHPQDYCPHSGQLQTIENLVDHVERNALTPKFRGNPNILQETLMGRSARLTGNTSNANGFIS
jgi:hypothetical protein